LGLLQLGQGNVQEGQLSNQGETAIEAGRAALSVVLAKKFLSEVFTFSSSFDP
jgi:hypothetical protein